MMLVAKILYKLLQERCMQQAPTRFVCAIYCGRLEFI